MYRKYYSINDMPQIREEQTEPVRKAPEVHKNVEEQIGFIKDGKVLGKFEIDDIILVIIAIILLIDDCDDKLLIFALGFVFLSGLL